MTEVSMPPLASRLPRVFAQVLCAAVLLPIAAVVAQPVPTDQPLDEPLGERVDFTISLQEGDEFAYRTRMELSVDQQQVSQDSVEETMSYDVTTKFTVQGVEDDGTATMALRVTEATIRLSTGEEVSEFTLDTPQEGEEFQNAFAASLAQTVVTIVVSPTGEITSVLGADAYESALSASEGADPRMLGFFTESQIREIYEPLFTIEELRDKPRRVGAGWATTREVELPPVAVLDLGYNWRFSGMLDGVATLTSRVEVTVRRPSTPDPARPTVVLEESSGNVLTQWDSELQAVTRRISTLQMKTQWALGEIQVNLDQSSVVRIERVPLEG